MNAQYQYILARDIIDMIRKYPNDADVLEYLESFCFSLARMLEQATVVDWDALNSICDQRYYSLKTTPENPTPLNVKELDALYSRYSAKI